MKDDPIMASVEAKGDSGEAGKIPTTATVLTEAEPVCRVVSSKLVCNEVDACHHA